MQLDLLDALGSAAEQPPGPVMAIVHAVREPQAPHAGAAGWVVVQRGPEGLQWLGEGATGRLVTRPLQMELQAVAEVLRWAEGRELELWAHSAPCHLGLVHHLSRWREAQWKTPDGAWVDEAWLWQQVADLLDLSNVRLRGHLAQGASAELPPSAVQRAQVLTQSALKRAEVEDAAPF